VGRGTAQQELAFLLLRRRPRTPDGLTVAERDQACNGQGKSYRVPLARLAGIDPIEARERARRLANASGVAFRNAFETFFVSKRKSLSNAKHAAQWRSTMESYVFQSIGNRPVGEIEAREILDLLTPIWFAKAETARRVLQRMEAVFKSAILRGYRERVSPCVGVKEELGTRQKKAINHRALPYQRVPAFLSDLRASNSQPVTRLAFEWLVAITRNISFHGRLDRPAIGALTQCAAQKARSLSGKQSPSGTGTREQSAIRKSRKREAIRARKSENWIPRAIAIVS
jgi:hypothetical protein